MTEGEIVLRANDLNLNGIYRYMGIPAEGVPPELGTEIDEMLRDAAAICRPRFCRGLFLLEECGGGGLTVGGKRFSTGNIISPFFTEAEYCLVYAVTSGKEFEAWSGAFSTSGEILKALIADSIGSEIAEAASAKMLLEASGEFAGEGLWTGNPYSPGYCGWDVREQQKLFSLLPDNPAGITLMPSSLMSPVKSVSGFVPVGRNVRKMQYGCAICRRKDCYKKVVK